MEKIEFTNLEDAISHLEKLEKDVGSKVDLYKQNLKELTGYDSTNPLSPLDVVKIVKEVFNL